VTTAMLTICDVAQQTQNINRSTRSFMVYITLLSVSLWIVSREGVMNRKIRNHLQKEKAWSNLDEGQTKETDTRH
jgi:hypothetical protein